MDSDKLGQTYANNMFVRDISNGLLYRFTLNEARDNIVINDTYSGNVDLLIDNGIEDPKENLQLIFGHEFGWKTDIQVGKDGYLYVLSYTGALCSILPASESNISSLLSITDQSLSPIQDEEEAETTNAYENM